jgi:acetate kinase
VRTVEDRAAAGDEACQLALAVFVRRIRKYLGAYLVDLGGQVDAIVFSAGEHKVQTAVLGSLVCGDVLSATFAASGRYAG